MAKKPAGSSSRRKTGSAGKKIPDEISFDFIKSNYFRVIAVEGAFGGLSPSARNIHMAIYSERRPIPRTTVHTVSKDGVLGAEERDKRDERSSYVREIEADLVMDLPTAISTRQWLDDKIMQIEKAGTVILMEQKDE
jgi:hypothetical protein